MIWQQTYCVVKNYTHRVIGLALSADDTTVCYSLIVICNFTSKKVFPVTCIDSQMLRNHLTRSLLYTLGHPNPGKQIVAKNIGCETKCYAQHADCKHIVFHYRRERGYFCMGSVTMRGNGDKRPKASCLAKQCSSYRYDLTRGLS